jgi:hypothetical protein
MFQTVDFDLTSLDLLRFAKLAFDAVDHFPEKKIISELDDAFGFLSIRSPSFQVTITPREDDATFIFELQGYNKLTFSDESATRRPAFYGLPLPKSLLIPKDSDSCAVTSAKLLNLGSAIADSNRILDVEEEIAVFDECATYQYTDKTSGLLQSLALCVNSLIMNSKSFRLSRILRRVLFATPVSWYHSFDILRVIRAIDLKLIDLVLGPSGFTELLRIVIQFCLAVNDDLSRASFEVLTKMTNPVTFAQLTRLVAQDADFLDSLSLQKRLLILARLIGPNCTQGGRKHLQWFLDAVLEMWPFYSDNIYILAATYQFLSCWDLTDCNQALLGPIILSARAVIYAARQMLTRHQFAHDLDEELVAKYKDIVWKYLTSLGVEIVSRDSSNYRGHFMCIHLATTFLLRLPVPILRTATGFAIAVDMFKYFPFECTQFCERRLPMVKSPKKREGYFRQIEKDLEIVADPHVHAKWCELALKCDLASAEGLLKMAEFAVKNPAEIDLQDLLAFVGCVEKFGQDVSIIPEMFRSLTEEREIELVALASEVRRTFSPSVEQIIGDICAKHRKRPTGIHTQVPFSALSEREKQMQLDTVLAATKVEEVDSDLISYAESKLTGWKLVIFRNTIGKFVPAAEDHYAFNPLYARSPSNFSLREKLKYFVDVDSGDGLANTLRAAAIDDVALDLQGIRFSHITLPRAMKFLQDHHSAQLAEIVRWLNPSHFHSPFKAAAVVAFGLHLDKFLTALSHTEHLSKRDLLAIAQAIRHVPPDANSDQLSAFLFAQFDIKAKSQQRLRPIIRMLTVFIEHFKPEEPQFSLRVLELFDRFAKILPEIEVGFCLCELSKYARIDAQKHVQLFYYLPMIKPSFVRLACRVDGLADLVTSPFPSVLCSGLRILTEATASPEHVKMVKSNILEAVTQAIQFISLFEVAHLVGHLVERVMINCKDLREVLIDPYMTEILVPARHPAFISVLQPLPTLIRSFEPESDEYRRLAKYCDSIMSRITSVAVFNIYCKGIHARLAQPSARELKTRFVRKIVIDFFDGNPNFDSYKVQQYLCGWATLFSAFVPVAESLNLILRLFIGNIPRFFPGFIELARIVKALRDQKSGNLSAFLRMFLEKTAEVERPEQNKRALVILGEGGSLRDAIRLSIANG